MLRQALNLLVLSLIGWLYVQAADMRILGFIHDDGVYVISAKALAAGQGFTLLNVPGGMPQLKYPFGLPLLLTPVWWLVPHFPQNIPALTGVVIGFALAAFWLLQDFLRRGYAFPGWLAWLVVLLVAFNFHVMHYTTAVMSEAPYLFFSLLTLWMANRLLARDGVASATALTGLAVLAAMATQVRVPGMALIAAIFLWLVMQRQLRGAILFGLVSFLLGPLPWLLWTRMKAPAINDLNYALVNTYNSYTREYTHNLQVSGYDFLEMLRSLNERVVETLFSIARNADGMYPVLKGVPDQVLFSLFSLLLLAWFGWQLVITFRAARQQGNLWAGFSIPGLYLGIYLGMITLWNYPDQMARFVGVVSPLLWLYFFKPMLPALRDWRLKPIGALLVALLALWSPIHGWQAWVRLLVALGLVGGWLAYLQKTEGRRPWQVAAVFLAVILSAWPMGHYYEVVRSSRARHLVDNGKYPQLWGEYQAAFAYIRHRLPQGAPLAARSDTVFYLYTGHPAYYLFNASLKRKNGKPIPEAEDILMRSLDHYGVHYLVMEPHIFMRVVRAPENLVAKGLMKRFPNRFQRIWRSNQGFISVYRILPRS